MRSHLRMNGRWRVGPVGSTGAGRPWLVLRGEAIEATQWNGPVLTLDLGPVRRLGPDLLADAIGSRRARRRGSARADGRGRSARCSRTSGSSPGSGTCGCRRRSGPSGVSPWLPVAEATRRGAPRRAAVGADGDARLGRGRAPGARRLPPRRASLQRAAGRRSSRAARATTTAPPTGAPPASRARQAAPDPFHGVGRRVRSGDDRNHARAPVRATAGPS